MGLERRWLGDEGNSASPARNRYNRRVSRIGHLSFFTKLKNYRLEYKEYNLYRPILIELDFIEKKGKRPYKGLPRGKK